MKKSPKQKIMDLAGVDATASWKENYRDIKSKVIDQMVDYLEPKEGESTAELKARLLGTDGKGSVSNSKLLKLHKNAMRLKDEFGGKKSNIIDGLLNAQKGQSGKVDEDYRTHLDKKSIATLILLHDHARKAGRI